MKTHDEIEELLGAYALDAVEPDEAAEVERHLADCPRCRAEVASHREVAAALANGGAADAPEGVWGRIAAAIDAQEVPEAVPAPVIGLGTRLRPGRQVGAPAWLAAVAAVAVLLVGVLGVQVVRQEDRLDRLAAAVEEGKVPAAAVAATFDPEARRIGLRGGDGRVLVSAVVRPDGEGYLAAEALPGLAASRTYQLWALVDGRPVSVSVLGADPVVVAFRAPARFDALALTEEQAGGAAAPSQAPFASGPVSTA